MTKIENTWFWLLLALLLKTLVILFLIYNLHLLNGDGLIGICGGDCPDYLHTAQNVAKYFTFGRVYDNDIIPYKGRMPGYDVVLAPLSLFLDSKSIMNLTILLQILLSAISTYFLAKIAYLLFNSQKIFYLVFFTYAINVFVGIYDLHILTESFSISALIISIYLIFLKPSFLHYLFAGCLFTWAFLMRPFLGVVLCLCVIYLAYKHYFLLKHSLIKSIIFLFIYTIPFLITEIVWTYRNYQHFDRFIPLAEGGFNEGRRLATMNLMSAWGFDFIEWNPQAEVLALLPPIANTDKNIKYKRLEDLPNYIYTSTYTIDSLRKVQELFNKINTPELPYSQYVYYDSIISSTLQQYRKDFIREKPLYYYLFAPIRLLGKFLFHSGTYNISDKPFAEQALFSQVVKIFYSMLYYFVLILGFLSYLFVIRLKKADVYLILTIPIYIIIFFTFFIRAVEYRYLTIAYPFLSLLACYTFSLLTVYFGRFKLLGV